MIDDRQRARKSARNQPMGRLKRIEDHLDGDFGDNSTHEDSNLDIYFSSNSASPSLHEDAEGEVQHAFPAHTGRGILLARVNFIVGDDVVPGVVGLDTCCEFLGHLVRRLAATCDVSWSVEVSSILDHLLNSS